MTDELRSHMSRRPPGYRWTILETDLDPWCRFLADVHRGSEHHKTYASTPEEALGRATDYAWAAYRGSSDLAREFAHRHWAGFAGPADCARQFDAFAREHGLYPPPRG